MTIPTSSRSILATLSPLVLALVVLAQGACNKGSGTYVILDFTSGVPDVRSIHVDLTLGSDTAGADFPGKNGDAITFPSTASIEIGSASGKLIAVATAKDGSGKTLATAMASVQVERGRTVHLPLPLTPAMQPGDLGDSGSLTIAPKDHDFGATVVDQMGTKQSFTVTNTGTMTTGALMVLLDGTDAADFFISQPPGCVSKTLGANEACTVEVTFAPKSPGDTKAASLHVLSADGTPGGVTSASLSGKAGPKGNLGWNEPSHNFPDTLLSSTGGDTTFTLTNSGSAPTSPVAVVVKGSDAGQFDKFEDNCSGSALPASSSCTVKVRAKPTVRGTFSATLEASASTGGLATVTLNLKGIIPAKLTIMNATTMGAPFDLGTVDVGSTGGSGQGNAYTFQVRNDGDLPTGDLMVDTTPMMADISPLAGLTCNPGPNGSPPFTTLNPGGSCTVVIGLKPSTFGKKDVTLTFSATPGGTASTYMTGVGHDQVTIKVQNASPDGSTGAISDTAMPHNFDCTGLPGTGMCMKTFDRTTTAFAVAMQASGDAASYSTFSQWTVPGTVGAPTCSPNNTSATCSFMLDASIAAGTYNFTANYKKQKFTLSYTRTDYSYGGAAALGTMTVEVNGVAGATCTGPCSPSVQLDGGTTIKISAADSATVGLQSLRRIKGPCTGGMQASASTSDADCTFTLDSDKTINIEYSAHNYAFVTSNTYNGSLGGIAGADIKCKNAAAIANLPGTFVALLSDSSTNARDRIPSTAQGWIRPDGERFAEDKDSLFGILPAGPQFIRNYRVYRPPIVDENGNTHNNMGDTALTFSDVNGLKLAGSMHCVDWTSSTDTTTNVLEQAVPSGGSGGWIHGSSTFAGAGMTTCNVNNRLYCFGTDLNAPVPPPATPPVGAKIMFLSAGTVTPGGGISRTTMDNVCKTEGQTAFGGGTNWKALVSTTASTAASQAPGGSYPVIRPDNLDLGDSTVVFGTNPVLRAAADQQADKTYIQDVGLIGQVFGGAMSPAQVGSTGDTCSDWGSSSGTSARCGWAYNTTIPFFNAGNFFSCSQARRFYCIQQ